MSRSRFSEEQIHGALSRVERGGCVVSISDDLGVSPQTLYRWRRRYGGPPEARIQRIRSLEEEVRRLRASVSDLRQERSLLQEVLQSKRLRPKDRRQEVRALQVDHGVSERKVCQALGWSRSSIRYESVANDQQALRRRLRQLAAIRPRSGYRTLWQLLRNEGWRVNHKRVYRLYREEGLGDRESRRRLAEEMRRAGAGLPPYQPRLQRRALEATGSRA